MIRISTSRLLPLLTLTAALAACSDKINTPDPTPKSSRVIYTKYDAATKNNDLAPTMISVNADGSGAQDLGYGYVTSSGGGKIVYGYATPTSRKARGIVVANADNSSPKQIYMLDTTIGYQLVGYPSIALNGSVVAFGVADSGTSSKFFLKVANSDGSSLRTLDDKMSYESNASVSPDGQYVAYYRAASGNAASLILARTDGTTANKITDISDDMNDLAAEISWNPSGTSLAYTDNGHVFIINTDGSGKVDLGPGLNPRWSPDGTTLAFVRDPGEYMWDVYITKDKGVTLTNLSNTTAMWELYPQWSSDGKYITCQSGTGDADKSTGSIKVIDVAAQTSTIVGTPGITPFFVR